MLRKRLSVEQITFPDVPANGSSWGESAKGRGWQRGPGRGVGLAGGRCRVVMYSCPDEEESGRASGGHQDARGCVITTLRIKGRLNYGYHMMK